jgi:hypothetical protein
MKKHEVTCRVCKERFDIANLKEGVDYVKPSRNFYYHKRCYDNWRAGADGVGSKTEDEQWHLYIYDFIARDMKVEYDYFKIEAQIKQFLKKRMTMKGIFFTLKYFYEIKKGDWSKGYGGIGIVEHVYGDAVKYWVAQENRSIGICAQIEKQMMQARESQVKSINYVKTKKKKKKKINLDDIGDMED